jgi:hypothetical protein
MKRADDCVAIGWEEDEFRLVIPAQAGLQHPQGFCRSLDPRFRGDDTVVGSFIQKGPRTAGAKLAMTTRQRFAEVFSGRGALWVR